LAARILITGGAGYIGSHTLVALIESGYEVICVDNFIKSNPKSLEGVEAITGKKIKNYAIDLCNYEAIKIIFAENKIDAVIHFAALKSVPESVEQPILYYENNITSLVNILKLCASNKVKQFVFSSSCSVYGNAIDLPVTEASALMPPQSPYANTKLIGENILDDFSKQNPMQIIKLRYFNPVGAHQSALIGEWPINIPNNLVPLITGNAIGKYSMLKIFGNKFDTRDGTCIRDFIHVMDVAEAHVCALKYLEENATVKNENINLGSGIGSTVLEAIIAFENVNNIKLNYEFVEPRVGDVVAIYCDNILAKETLKWEPKRNLNEMMQSAWQWEKVLADS
jgi:UDP-glucose 4-epimerase